MARLFSHLAHDIGIDLGTANVLVYLKGSGIIINEPSVVAMNTRTREVLAIGDEAKRMVGRTPSHIVATRPLVDGVISDFDITEQMLRYFIGRVHRHRFRFLLRPRVVIGIPYGVTEVERRAVEESALNAGAREVYLIEEPLAAAIGARLPVQEATGNMIVDVGGGTTEVAVISLGGVVASRSLRVAGDELNNDIITHVRDNFNLLLGERTAEEVKMAAGSALPLKSPIQVLLRGRDLVSGLPKMMEANDEDIRRAISRSLSIIVEAVRATIEETPPELVADIMEKGIVLSGGGALLRGLGPLIATATGTKVHIADDPLTAVVRGTGVVIEDLGGLRGVLLPSQAKRLDRVR